MLVIFFNKRSIFVAQNLNIYHPFICKWLLHYFSGAHTCGASQQGLLWFVQRNLILMFLFLAPESCHILIKCIYISAEQNSRVKIAELLWWQTSDPGGGAMVDLSQIHINIHEASPLMFQLQVRHPLQILIWAALFCCSLTDPRDGKIRVVWRMRVTNIPRGKKIKSFKTSHLCSRVTLVHRPAFHDAPLICWSVFNKGNGAFSDAAASDQQI